MDVGVLIQTRTLPPVPRLWGVIYAAEDRGVVAGWQRWLRYDGPLPPVPGSVAAAPDLLYLVAGDNPADYRRSPIIIRRNQIPCAVMQFQGGISQGIRNIIWRPT